jgi:hypothetical protein
MAQEPLPGGWLPPSDREYTPPPPDEPGPPQAGRPAGDDDVRGWALPGPPGGPPQRSSNAKANWSLALAIGGLIVCPLVLSVLALVLGYQARREIDASGGRQQNRGTATAGIIIGWVGLVIGLLVLVLIAAGVEISFNVDSTRS